MTEQEQQAEQKRHNAYELALLKWILGLITFGLIALAGWTFRTESSLTTLSEKTSQASTDRAELRQADRDHDADLAALDARTRVLEGIAARQDERWRGVQATLDRIDGRLNRVIEALESGR